MPKAFSYVRFSTPEQARGDSFRRQTEDARAFAREHRLELDESLRDLGRSAFRGGHAKTGALASFLRLVEDGIVEPGSYLIVESLDRLSREEVIDAASRLLALINAGINVVTLADRQVYSRDSVRDNWTLLILSLSVMARAHEESRTKSLRVGKAWAEKRRRAIEDKQPMTSIAPAWIRLVGGPRAGRYELWDERAAVVRRIFDDTIAGLGRRAIAKSLNHASVEPWGRGAKRGERWHDSYIQKILNNPATFGAFESLGKRAGGSGAGAVLIPAYYPPAIDEETFYRAQAATARRRAGDGRPSAGHRNMLRGLAKCMVCSANLVIVDKGKRSAGPKLICARAHASSGCTERTYYPYPRVENAIMLALEDFATELIVSGMEKRSSQQADLASLIARRGEVQRRLDNLLEVVAAEGGGRTVAARVTGLEEQVEALDGDIERLDLGLRMEASSASSPDGGLAALRQVYGQLHGLEGDELGRMRAIMHQRLAEIVDRVEVSPERIRLYCRGRPTPRVVSGDMTHPLQFFR